jgi:hypothetical protein
LSRCVVCPSHHGKTSEDQINDLEKTTSFLRSVGLKIFATVHDGDNAHLALREDLFDHLTNTCPHICDVMRGELAIPFQDILRLLKGARDHLVK